MSEQETVQEQDPMKMDLSDLGDMLNDQANAPEQPEDGEEITEPEAAEPEDDVEASNASDDAPSDDDETEAPDEESEETPEELKLRLAAAEAEQKRWESIAGRNEGERGFLRQELEKAQAEMTKMRAAQSRPRETEDFEPESESRYRPAPQPAPESRLPPEMVKSAMDIGAQGFALEHPETLVETSPGQRDYSPEMKQALLDLNVDTSALIGSNDAGFITGQTKLILESAYRKLEADKATAALKAERESLRVDQAEALKRKKRASAASSTGTQRAASTPKPKDPNTMPIDKLAKEIDRLNR